MGGGDEGLGKKGRVGDRWRVRRRGERGENRYADVRVCAGKRVGSVCTVEQAGTESRTVWSRRVPAP